MKFEEYRARDGLALAALVQRGEVSAAELLEVALARCDAAQPAIHAVVRRLDERARQRAARHRGHGGVFAGVPFLVKDLFQEIAHEVHGCGSRALAEVRAEESSDFVRAAEGAGLVIFGQTNTPEFGAKNVTEPQANGASRNPWSLARTPGGSSGGSAAAVAAGIVPMAGANDGGGSIRIPAAACGLFGLKVGRGRVSTGPGVAEGMFGAVAQGVVSRSVRDTAAMLDVLQGPQPHAPYWMPPSPGYLTAIERPPRALRIGYSTASPIGTPVDPQAVAAVEDAARLLQSLGHHVEPAAPPVDGMALSKDFLLMWFGMQAMLVDEVRRRTGAPLSSFEPDTRVMAALGASTRAPELLACHQRWHEHTRALARFHERHDLWLSPTLAGPPLRIGEHATPRALHVAASVAIKLGLARALRSASVLEDTVRKNLGWTPYTQLANLTGRPAMSVPLHWTPDGLPLGVQFVGGLDSEATLLQLAAQLEQARPWFDRVPAEPLRAG
jgi:amidase